MSSTNEAMAQLSPDDSSRPHPRLSRRRDKPQLSCNQCRRRKSRCDRKQPCSNCSSRSQTCTYSDSQPFTSKPVPALQDRLAQLERLVMSLKSDSANQPNPGLVTPDVTSPVDTPIDGRSECGSMRMSASELKYIGGDHWAAIMDSFADLKDHFDREEQSRLVDTANENQDDCAATMGRTPHALLLYGGIRPASRAEILATLPPKDAVDRYISRYFNRLDLVASSVHGPRFLREYEAFWANPAVTPIMWVGLLFSMMCLALLASDPSECAQNSELDQQSIQIELYREKIVQCLIMGEYTKSGPHVLETVIHYVYVEFCINSDAEKDMWFLLALEMNLAMRMGYHRDPSHFPGISPLQAEMRRRLWATVLMGDILISSQMGMPRMISDWKCDTTEPRNLNDVDIDEDTVELPPSRPETELTTTLGVIARRRILVALGTISSLGDTVRPRTYAEVMRVDTTLHEAAANIPGPLKMKPMAASMTDSPQVIMSRLFISHMIYKGQIMLHRRFLYMNTPSRDDDTFLYSRKACLDASLGSLQIQHILDEETCPGGQLFMMRWRVTSIMNHQFLTATMILCSLLRRGQTLHKEEEIITALRRARLIWIRRSHSSEEAKKAAEIIGLVLARTGEDSRFDKDYQAMEGQFNFNEKDLWLGLDGQSTPQSAMNCNDPNSFVIPALLGVVPPPDLEGQSSTFSTNTTESGPGLNEWTPMSYPETSWL